MKFRPGEIVQIKENQSYGIIKNSDWGPYYKVGLLKKFPVVKKSQMDLNSFCGCAMKEEEIRKVDNSIMNTITYEDDTLYVYEDILRNFQKSKTPLIVVLNTGKETEEKIVTDVKKYGRHMVVILDNTARIRLKNIVDIRDNKVFVNTRYINCYENP